MRCETSFFSLTLLKKHLTRYWPLWAVWLAGWILALPVNLWNEAKYGGGKYMVQNLDQALAVSGVLIGMAAPIVAVAVFFHLFKAPAANFIGALPLRREGVFATAFLAGYIMLAAPLALTAFVMIMVEWAVGIVAAGPLMTLLGGCLLQSFFWLSFATLCCVISGSGVASVCFYVIFNGVVAGMTMLIQNVLSAFLYGFSAFGERVYTAVLWLTPVGMMAQDDHALGYMLTSVSRMEMLWVYAAVGFLMLLAAVGLHHIRKAERSGDLIAFVPLRWVFRISVTFCGGLAFGLLLLALIFDGRVNLPDAGAALAMCCAVAAVISWFAAEMLLQKSFKVFKNHWKGAVIGAACFILAICAIDMDWIGFTTRVPAPNQVKSAAATFGGYCDPMANDGLTYDKDSVADIIALHQYLVDHQNTGGEYYGRLTVEYDLGLTRLRREYSFNYGKGDELLDLFAAAQVAGKPVLDETLGDPANVYVDIEDTTGTLLPGDLGGWGGTLDAVQGQAAWKAILEDYRAGRYRPEDPRGEGRWSMINLEWIDKDRQMRWTTIYVRPGATSINRFLERLVAGEYGPVDGVTRMDPEVFDVETGEPYVYNAQYDTMVPWTESEYAGLDPVESLPPPDLEPPTDTTQRN